MAALPRTRALMTELAAALGLASLPADDSGGYHFTIGADTEIYIFGGDDKSFLMIAPVAPLPREPGYGLVVYLLRNNMFSSDDAPFQIAVDEGGTVLFWGRLNIAEFSGAVLGALIECVVERVAEIRGEIQGEPKIAGA